MVTPGTAKAERVARELVRAAKIDRLNAESYRGGPDSEAAIFYSKKADEAGSLLSQLRNNKPILAAEVTHALDTSKAIRYTGGD